MQLQLVWIARRHHIEEPPLQNDGMSKMQHYYRCHGSDGTGFSTGAQEYVGARTVYDLAPEFDSAPESPRPSRRPIALAPEHISRRPII